jgi:hypothetical protein
MNKNQKEKLLKSFSVVWSKESSSKWSKENPANGQCGVTALVVNELFGGDIFKTPTPDGWHYCNRINGKRYEFTESQFSEPIKYMDVPANRNRGFFRYEYEPICVPKRQCNKSFEKRQFQLDSTYKFLDRNEPVFFVFEK